MTTLPKGTTVDTTNIQPVEPIHMEFAFYNVTPIKGFTYMMTSAFEKTRIIWVFNTAPKISPVRIVCLVFTTLKNKKHPCKCMTVNEDISLEKSTGGTKLLFYDFSITTETTSGNTSWIIRNNERHNRSINTMVRAGILDSNPHEKKW